MPRPELSETIQLPSGEVVPAPDYTIVPGEQRIDTIERVVGTQLLPSDRRAFEFARRSLSGIINDPRDPRFNLGE